MLKKFIVTCNIADQEMIEGTKPYDLEDVNIAEQVTEAVNEEEAIELVKDWLRDQIQQNGCGNYDFEVSEEDLKATNLENGRIEMYHNFKAIEQK